MKKRMKPLKWIRSKFTRNVLVYIPPNKRKKVLIIAGIVLIIFFFICRDKLSSIPVRTINGRIVRDFRAPVANVSDITLVTLYFNLGVFDKGIGLRPPEQYFKWMKIWSWITNPVVAFFEDKDSLEQFRNVRKGQPIDKTTIYRVSRSELKGFQSFQKVRAIFSDPYYPKHVPNTVNPEYACTMASKVDALEIAIKKNVIKTKYVAWLDLGYFRLLREPYFSRGRPILTLEAPTGFNPDTVGFSEVDYSENVFSYTPQEIIERDLSWVSTGFFIATPQVMTKFIEDFRAARQELLDKGQTSSCQQIVAALYSGQLATKPSTRASTYTCRTGQFGLYRPYDRDYYCLGFLTKEMGDGRLIDDVSPV